MTKVYTIDAGFENAEYLNSSVEKVRGILDKLKSKRKISGYYLMRYINANETFLGIKFLVDELERNENTSKEVKNELIRLNGYTGLKQETNEESTELLRICSESMELRNRVWDILGRKPTDNEFMYIIHYLANPLLLNSEDELRILQKRIRLLKGE